MRTRRKQMVLQVHCPEIVFIELLKPLQTGDAKDLEWIEEGKTLKAAARRGEKTNLISRQVTGGNVIMNLKVPKNERAMPQLTMKYSVATMMDKNGHVI
ncbi:hypothetical protein AB1Y20_023713 [Prymnesium parvum]|uniref:Uncharacterized protein n=1 Tax=Prymnesium parvum TaxID=97485 RepID=A0AB34JH21_PRYPA